MICWGDFYKHTLFLYGCFLKWPIPKPHWFSILKRTSGLDDQGVHMTKPKLPNISSIHHHC